MSRRVRSFKRWMNSQGIDYSDGLEFVDGGDEQGISVKAICDLNEGDLVATIPKNACLTIKTSAAGEMIEESELGGSLGLSVALMYERSLGKASRWAGYLQLLPDRECMPLVWTLEEIDILLCGTELHKTMKEDKTLIYEDWKESILPLIESGPLNLDPKSFGVEEYFAAKSLVSSRSFEIDDYHGYGMVPLADLFNHKTGAENVHFTDVSSHSDSNNEEEDIQSDFDNEEEDIQSGSDDDNYMNGDTAGDPTAQEILVGKDINAEKDIPSGSESSDNDSYMSSDTEGDPTALEMIVVRAVKAGNEVFNTYGTMGNAALLHRYGFTEPENLFDIVNIDLNLVLKWTSSLLSSRYSRARLLLWRRLDCSGCVSENSEYFEISSDGEPQIELLILLYIICLPEEEYLKLNRTLPEVEDIDEAIRVLLWDDKSKSDPLKTPEMVKELLLTEEVCDALVSLADIRESFYGLNSMGDDMEALRRCCCIKERKLYHSLVLRVSERRILEKLRTYASSRSCSRPKKSAFVKKS